MTKNLSEIQITFHSDFGIVWISDIHWTIVRELNFSKIRTHALSCTVFNYSLVPILVRTPKTSESRTIGHSKVRFSDVSTRLDRFIKKFMTMFIVLNRMKIKNRITEIRTPDRSNKQSFGFRRCLKSVCSDLGIPL